VAERVGGVGAEQAHLVREEGQLLERQLEVPVLGVAFHIGVELGRAEAAADHVAFQPCHVDAVGRETAQRLVQRRRHVTHPEHKAGDQRAGSALAGDRTPRQHQKTRGVVVGILDIRLERFQPIDLPRQARSNRRFGGIVPVGQFLRGAGGIGMDDGIEPELADHAAALGQGVHVAAHDPDGFQRRAFGREQMMIHPHEMFAHDEKTRIRHQPVNIGNPAGHRIFDRRHGVFGAALGDRGKHVLEGLRRQGVHVGINMAAGEMRIGAGQALEGNGVGGAVGAGHRR